MDKHLDNGFLLLKEDKRMASPLAVVYYEEYESIQEAEKELSANKEGIQCIISSSELSMNILPFGQSQRPGLWDYADEIDTMAFLRGL
jgi:hypothetical protein